MYATLAEEFLQLARGSGYFCDSSEDSNPSRYFHKFK
jgi:hypothetical protein